MKKILSVLFLLTISCKYREPIINPNRYPTNLYPVNSYPINPYSINPYQVNPYNPVTYYQPQLRPIVISKPGLPNINITEQKAPHDTLPIVISEKYQKPTPFKITIKRDSLNKPYPISIYIDPKTGTVVQEKGSSTEKKPSTQG